MRPWRSVSRYRQSRWLSKERGYRDRKSTRLNSSHLVISYAVFCLKKKKRASGDTALPAAETRSRLPTQQLRHARHVCARLIHSLPARTPLGRVLGVPRIAVPESLA